MKIAVILPSLKNQAPIKIALAIADGITRKGHSVDVFYFDDSIEIDIPNNVNIIKSSFCDKKKFDKYDIVHSHLFRADLFVLLTRIRSLVKGRSKTKYISTLHNYVYSELNSYYNIFISFFFGTIWNFSWLAFDALAVLSNDSVKYYKKLSFNKKIYRVYNGHDINIDTSCLDVNIVNKINLLKKNGFSVLGTYCNLTKQKNISSLIEHVSRVETSVLVVFGDGVFKEKLIKLSNDLNVNNRVLFFDATKNAHQYNEFFDVFIIPSIKEGFGLSLIEAALHKKKIVCSQNNVFPELFNDDEVFFFNLNDKKSLDSSIAKAIQSEVNEKAYIKAVELYSKKMMVNNYLYLYDKLRRVD